MCKASPTRFSGGPIQIVGTPPPAPRVFPAPPRQDPFGLTPQQVAPAVSEFRALFTDRQAKYHVEYGQFAVVEASREQLAVNAYDIKDTALKREILELIRETGWNTLAGTKFGPGVKVGKTYQEGLPAGHPDKHKTIGVVRSAVKVAADPVYQAATRAARLAMVGVDAADRAVAQQILDDPSATGQAAYDSVNKWLALPALGPMTFPALSLPRQVAMYINCKVQCGSAANATGLLLLKARGINPASVASFAHTTLATKTDRDSRSPKGTGNMILKYKPQALANAMTAASAVLANGYLIAGCLSGAEFEPDEHPFPEHYFLIFKALGNKFLFWDPAVSATNITAPASHATAFTQMGPGIGVLAYDTSDPARPMFSTGYDFTDLNDVVTEEKHDFWGDHKFYTRRHRYQVATLYKPVPPP
jgi:hypothetical protein